MQLCMRIIPFFAFPHEILPAVYQRYWSVDMTLRKVIKNPWAFSAVSLLLEVVLLQSITLPKWTCRSKLSTAEKINLIGFGDRLPTVLPLTIRLTPGAQYSERIPSALCRHGHECPLDASQVPLQRFVLTHLQQRTLIYRINGPRYSAPLYMAG